MNLDDRISELVRAAMTPLLVEHLDGLEDRIVTRLASEMCQQRSAAQPEPAFLTLKQVAESLQVHPRTVQRRVKEGRIPAPITISPNCLRWRRTDVDALGETGGAGG